MSDTNGRVTDRCSSDAESDTSDADAGTDRGRALDRRRLLTAGGAATTALLAGCAGLVPKGGPFSGADRPGDDTATPEDGDGEATATETATAAGTPTADTDVTGLVLKSDEDAHRFIVTLRVPSSAGGADWWQVETLDGTKLARNEFDSPRTESQFTTSMSVDVSDVSAVVVRGHDVEQGYGGQALLVDVESGEIDVARQGAEPESFADYSF